MKKTVQRYLMMVALFMSLLAVKAQAQNNALNFNGYNNYNQSGVQNTVTCGNTIGNFGTSDFTIEFYINTTSQDNNGEWILTKRSVCGHESYLNILISGGYVGGGLDGDGSGTNIIDVTSTVKVNDGNWHHVAFVRSGTTIQFYIDGASAGSKTGSGITNINNTDNLVIGGFGSACSTNQLFIGSLDELRIWNVARAQSDIQANMTTELVGNESGLISYYNFNQGSANGTNIGVTTLNDKTANVNNGTLNNFALTGTTSNWVSRYSAFIPAPGNFTYTTTNTFTVGAAITSLSPTPQNTNSTSTIATGFGGVRNIATDASGNIYVVDNINKKVYKIAPTSTSGTGTAIAAPSGGFGSLYGVAVDANSNIYVGDQTNNKVWKITSGGSVTSIGSGFSAPAGVAVDANGNVYVQANSAIKKIATDGTTVTTLVSSGVTSKAIAVDAAGQNVYYSTGTAEIKKLNVSTGTITGIGTVTAGSGSVKALAVDLIGNVYVADAGGGDYAKIFTTGTTSFIGSSVTNPYGIAIDNYGNIYTAAALSTNTLQKLLLSGGTATSYSISPTLPAGLSFNTTTGFVTGTPTAASVTTSYIVTATNTTGSSFTTFSIMVNKATPTITTVPTASTITYGQTLANSTLSGGVASVAGTFAFTTTTTAPSVGTASQGYTFTPTDATNYTTVTGSVSVTVTKATPTITTAPTASAITYGQTLANSTLSGGVASVVGTFTFTTTSTAPSAGTASQGYTFTPTDNTNYNTVTGTVSVSVVLPSFTYNFSGNKAFRDLGAVLTNVNTSQFNSSKVYAYTNGTWAAYSGVMTPGKGYRILVDGTATPTITTTGDAVLTGNQSLTINGGQDKFSFIANPYQAQVDFTAVTKSGLYNGYWYFNPKQFVNGYLQYNYYGSNLGASNIYSGNAASQYLQAGQGFFVCSNTSGTPSFTFTEASKYAGAAPISVFGVSAPLNRIATGLFKNGSNIDGAVTVFNNSFYNSMASEDGLKMNNAGENLTFTVAGNDLCANGWSMPSATDQLPMHLYNLTPNTAYTIKLDASQFKGNGLSAYLQDNVLNTKTLLTGTDNEVTFTTGSDATTDANRYTIVFGVSPLPVKSISLTATILSNSQVSVKWTTVGESNIANYKVERSTDGTNFTALATVAAGVISYSYQDATSLKDAVFYYRIKATDNLGVVGYSKVAKVQLSVRSKQLSVYPNPVVNNTFNLSFVGAGKYTVSLVDALGKTVYTTIVNHFTATTVESIALNTKLATGNYTVKAVDDKGNVLTTQVVIK